MESRLITVEMLGLLLVSGVAERDPGVAESELPGAGAPADDNLWSRSATSPCRASGAGSIPRRVNRSASDAKHLNAPSAT